MKLYIWNATYLYRVAGSGPKTSPQTGSSLVVTKHGSLDAVSEALASGLRKENCRLVCPVKAEYLGSSINETDEQPPKPSQPGFAPSTIETLMRQNEEARQTIQRLTERNAALEPLEQECARIAAIFDKADVPSTHPADVSNARTAAMSLADRAAWLAAAFDKVSGWTIPPAAEPAADFVAIAARLDESNVPKSDAFRAYTLIERVDWLRARFAALIAESRTLNAVQHAMYPAAGDGGSSEGLVECCRRVLAERDALRKRVEEHTAEIVGVHRQLDESGVSPRGPGGVTLSQRLRDLTGNLIAASAARDNEHKDYEDLLNGWQEASAGMWEILHRAGVPTEINGKVPSMRGAVEWLATKAKGDEASKELDAIKGLLDELHVARNKTVELTNPRRVIYAEMTVRERITTALDDDLRTAQQRLQIIREALQ